MRDMRVGGEADGDGGANCVSVLVVILEANEEDELLGTPTVADMEGMGKVAAMGHGSKALGVGIADGRGYSIIVVLPCRRTRLKVLPEGDHMKAMFAP